MLAALEVATLLDFALQDAFSIDEEGGDLTFTPITLSDTQVALWNAGKSSNAPAALRTAAIRLTSNGNLNTYQKILAACASALGLRVGRDTERKMVDGTQRETTLAVQLAMPEYGPELVGAWLVWSARLRVKVRVRDWTASHRQHQTALVDGLLAEADFDWFHHDQLDLGVGTAPSEFTVATDSQRREFYDGRVLASELARLRAIPDVARCGKENGT